MNLNGNSGTEKYQVALIDGITHKIIDILPCRRKAFLCDYFKKIPKSERDKVKFFVSDLWETYKDISFTYFRNAIFVADHFHFIRMTNKVVDDIRKKVQRNLPQSERKYFKHSRNILLSNFFKIENNESKITQLKYMLYNFSEDLRIAYNEKEDLLNIISSNECSDIKIKRFNQWIKYNLNSPVKELRDCAKTYFNWHQAICNSLKVPYTNGPIEGINNKIKTLKKITFGMKNFNNFRTRIMLLDLK